MCLEGSVFVVQENLECVLVLTTKLLRWVLLGK